MQELQDALGRYLQEWHSQLVPTTPAMEEYVQRAFAVSVAWVPGRMVDAAEEMLGAWRHNNNGGKTGQAMLPVVLVALAKDFVPISGDFGMQVATKTWVTLPADTKGRVFQMQIIVGLRRAQFLVVAAEEATAGSIAQQLILWNNQVENRRFYATYQLAGIEDRFSIQLESNDGAAQNIATNQKNITLLAVDMNLIESIPQLRVPKVGEPNDGKGDGTRANPNGFAVTQEAGVNDLDNGFNRLVTTPEEEQP